VVDSRPNIWQLQSRRDIQGLIHALEYPDPEVRKRAAVALRTMDVVQAVPALKAALQRETDPQTRTNIAETLHVLDHRTDVKGLVKSQDLPGLLRVLKSRHPESVIAAARALGRLGDRSAVEPLIMLFQNSSAPPRVRLAAAEALLELKSAPAVVTLLGALRRDNWQVRRNAAAVLGQIQATWAVEPLAAALNDSHPVVQRTAAAALRRIGTSDAIAALRTYFARRSTTEAVPAITAPSPALAPRAASQPPAPPQPAPTPPPLPEREASRPPDPPVVSPTFPTTPPPSETEAPTQPESPSKVTRPVMKLIAYLKQRSS